MDRIKKAIGYTIFILLWGGVIYVYADMVIKDGWWRGLILPLLLMAGLISIIGLAVWLIFSSNKKHNKHNP